MNMVLDDKRGTVLIMVLMFMLSAIMIGMVLMKSTIIETKIVANERLYNQAFYNVESAAEFILPQFDDIVSAQTWVVDTRVPVSDKMPNDTLKNADVGMTLVRTGAPPVGSGSSATKTTAYYFRIDATLNNQSVEMGRWKAFPKPGS